MRRFVLLAALLCLVACNDEGADQPFVDSRIPPDLDQRFWPPVGWAWGLIQTAAAPPVRYGVAGPLGVRPKGDILILTGYGESAEVWFETVTALRDQGYTVWVLEQAGQGGSARFTRPRDLGHRPDAAADREAVLAMLAVIRRPPLILAQSTAAPTVLALLSSGVTAPAVILSAPAMDPAAAPIRAGAAVGSARVLAKLRLGWLRAAGQPTWERQDHPPRERSGLIASWSQANPDLRMGGVSWGWIAVFQEEIAALTPERLRRVRTPVLILAGGGDRRADALCRALANCTARAIPAASGSIHLEGDTAYRPWAGAVSAEAARVFTGTVGP